MKKYISILLLSGLLLMVYQNGVGIGRAQEERKINEWEADEAEEAQEDTSGKREPVEYRYIDKFNDPEEGFADHENTIFWQDFNKDYGVFAMPPTVGYQIELCSLDSLQDYFLLQYASEIPFWPDRDICCMFYDERTIDMKEEELELLFLQNGYELAVCTGNCGNYQVRFLQYREKNSYFLYPEHIIMQTWNDQYIYVQEITSPMQRKIMGVIGVDNRPSPLLIVHSTGMTRDYVSEEELSFWEFNGNYWSLVPLDLEIEYIQDIHGRESGKTEDLNPVYYPDGIAFRTIVQYCDPEKTTYYLRLHDMEELEKNKSFQFTLVQESLAISDLSLTPRGRVRFEIK